MWTPKFHFSNDAAQKLEVRDSKRVEVFDDLDNNNFYMFGFHLDKFCCGVFEPDQLYVTNTCSYFDLLNGDS